MTVAAEFGKNLTIPENLPNDFMVDENHTIIGGAINDMTNQSAVCPPDAICSYGMHGGLTLAVLFIFFLGIISGWAMHIYSNKHQKKIDTEILADPKWDKGATIEGEHEYSPNCEVYGCDGNHV